MPLAVPLYNVDVFVDYFLGLGQGSKRRLRALRRTILHAIDQVFDRPRAGDKNRNEAASVKKLLQGDGAMNTRKLMLGWIIDTILGTIELPEHRKDRLQSIFDGLRGKRRISAKNWHKILGELRFMSLGIPGSAVLFSALQVGLSETSDNRVRIDRFVREHLDDFECLANYNQLSTTF